MKVRYAIFPFVLLVSLCCTGITSDDQVGQQLNEMYVKKALLLRHSVHQNSQQYDTAGTLLNGAPEESWTLYSPVEITRVDLTRDRIEIRGNRLIYFYDQKRNTLVAHREEHPEKVKIEIMLDAPLVSVEQANATISKVFASDEKELIPSLPDYWQRYFQRAQNPSTTTPKLIARQPVTVKEQDASFGRIGIDGTKAPQPVSTPEPEYPVFAKRQRIQGVCVMSAIIDKEGRVHDAYIVRPLGAGLDEQALAVVQRWKFKPATRDGQPVNVQMGLEINFHLY